MNAEWIRIECWSCPFHTSENEWKYRDDCTQCESLLNSFFFTTVLGTCYPENRWTSFPVWGHNWLKLSDGMNQWWFQHFMMVHPHLRWPQVTNVWGGFFPRNSHARLSARFLQVGFPWRNAWSVQWHGDQVGVPVGWEVEMWAMIIMITPAFRIWGCV